MNRSTMRARLLTSSMISGVALAAFSATGAFAQTAPAPAAAPEASTVGELVVTGSRIPQPNLTSVSPVTSVNQQAIKLAGAINVEDFVNQLPQAFANFGSYQSNGATGTANVDLRGLDKGDGSTSLASRTLVLIDGKRLQPGDPTVPVPDLDMIPPGLIDRVEVLTGGASAVYGSDAIAGVVNFIMKKNFEGLQIDAETSFAESSNDNQQVRTANTKSVNTFGLPSLNFPSSPVWDGLKTTVTITGGANAPDGKGNVEFYFGYTSTQAVTENERDYSLCSLETNNTNSAQQFCGGSSNSATGRITPENGPNAKTAFFIQPAADPTTGLLPRENSSRDFNFAPFNYFQRPDTRYTAGEFSNYQVTPWLDAYSSFMFMDDHTVGAVAPSGSFFGDKVFNIPCDDPLLSPAEATTLCGPAPAAGAIATAEIGRRNVEGGPRTADLEHMDYRLVIGAKGDIGNGWSYDVSAQYGRSVLTEAQGGYFSYTNLENALDVIPNPAVGGVLGVAVGAPVCAAALPGGASLSCVPYNLWTPGGVSKASLQYLTALAENTGATDEQVVTGSITGDLGHYGFTSPWAKDGVGISVGAEYRREFLETQYDAAIQSGDLAGFGGSILNTTGSQSDDDVFGEIRIPIIQNMPGFEDLEFEGGYRYSDYTSGGGNSTYKLGVDWQTIPDLRFRGSYERATRAPNVQELFDPPSPGLVPGTDPCGGATPTLSAAQCFNTISHSDPTETLAQFEGTSPGGAIIYGSIPQCISAQCGNISGGNPDLVPETATTYSVGAVLTPRFVKGLSITVDYFNIDVEKAIITVPATTLLNNCAVLDTAFDCSNFNRSLTDGAVFGDSALDAINQVLVNGSALKTNGVDVNLVYRSSFTDWGLPDWGSLTFDFNGTYLHKLVTILPDGTGFDCAGLFGITCGAPSPKWRHQLRVSWATPWDHLTLSANWRHLSGANLDFDTSVPDLQNGFKDTLPTDAHVPTFDYFDLAFQWRFMDRYQLRGGVNNIFDRTPPLEDQNSFGISAPPFGNGNTYPQVYDPLGRVFFVGLTADF